MCCRRMGIATMRLAWLSVQAGGRKMTDRTFRFLTFGWTGVPDNATGKTVISLVVRNFHVPDLRRNVTSGLGAMLRPMFRGATVIARLGV